MATAKVQATIAQARSNRFKLEHAENVNAQIDQLQASVAALDSDLADATQGSERVRQRTES